MSAKAAAPDTPALPDRKKGYDGKEVVAALIFVLPFAVIYGVLFIYPTLQMIWLSLHKAPLIGAGTFVGIDNYLKLFKDKLFGTAVWNTIYFVLLSVLPSTLIGLAIAMGVNRLKGWAQSIILACFFIPYILPVSVVFRVWTWMLDLQFGIMQPVIALVAGQNTSVFRTLPLFMPAVAFITVWWTIGFNILLFIAGLRNIPTRWQRLRRCGRARGAGHPPRGSIPGAPGPRRTGG